MPYPRRGRPKKQVPVDKLRGMQLAAALAATNSRLYVDFSLELMRQKVVPHPIHEIYHLMIECCMNDKRHLVFITPPEHAKSFQIVKNFEWRIGKNPALRVGIVSASEKVWKRNLNMIRTGILTSFFRQTFPGVEPEQRGSMTHGEWSQEQLYLKGQLWPCATAGPLNAAGEGWRCDVLLLDDCVTQECLKSEAERENVRDKIFQTWMNRVTDDGIAVVFNNVWHRDDAIHGGDRPGMMNSPAFTIVTVYYTDDLDGMHWKIKNPPPSWKFATEGVFPLWDVWSRERLEKKRSENSAAFKRLFMAMPQIPEDMRFPPKAHWKRYKPEDLSKAPGVRIVGRLDPSGGKSVKRGDYAARVHLLRLEDGRCLVLPPKIGRYTPSQQVNSLWDLDAEVKRLGWRGLDRMTIEALHKEQEWIRRDLESETERRRQALDPSWKLAWYLKDPGRQKKESWIDSLITPIERGFLLFPENLEWLVEHDESWRLLCNQIEDYPWGDYDDAADALAKCYIDCEEMGKYEPETEEEKRQREELVMVEEIARRDFEEEQQGRQLYDKYHAALDAALNREHNSAQDNPWEDDPYAVS